MQLVTYSHGYGDDKDLDSSLPVRVKWQWSVKRALPEHQPAGLAGRGACESTNHWSDRGHEQ